MCSFYSKQGHFQIPALGELGGDDGYEDNERYTPAQKRKIILH